MALVAVHAHGGLEHLVSGDLSEHRHELLLDDDALTRSNGDDLSHGRLEHLSRSALLTDAELQTTGNVQLDEGRGCVDGSVVDELLPPGVADPGLEFHEVVALVAVHSDEVVGSLDSNSVLWVEGPAGKVVLADLADMTGPDLSGPDQLDAGKHRVLELIPRELRQDVLLNIDTVLHQQNVRGQLRPVQAFVPLKHRPDDVGDSGVSGAVDDILGSHHDVVVPLVTRIRSSVLHSPVDVVWPPPFQLAVIARFDRVALL